MEYSSQEDVLEFNALAACEILDTPAESEYDDVIQVAAAVCGTTMAAFGLADGERFWFKAKLGFSVEEIPRNESICCAVLDTLRPLLIPDILEDARWRDSKILRDLGVRCFAGVSVRCMGEVVGALCVAGTEPKELSATELGALEALARQVAALLDSRLANRMLTGSEKQLANALANAELANEHATLAARRFETLFGRIPVPCFTCDTDMTVFEWNRAAKRLWNLDAFEAVMRSVPDVLDWPLDSGFIPEGLYRVFGGENVEGYEWKTTLPDGSHRWLSSSAFPLQSSRGDVVGAVCTCADITAIKDSEERLNEYSCVLQQQQIELTEANVRLHALATTDGLTGLKNHRLFQEFLEKAVEQARRYHHPLSIVLTDLDQFKRYNDTFGHPAGDAALIAIGKIFNEVLRTSDLAARYGGEEFVAVLPETDIEGAKLAAERLRTAIEAHTGFCIPMTASFGVSSLELPTDNRERLIKCADRALYASKAAGRNRVTHWVDIRAADAA